MQKKILLMHITKNSGHHAASLAIEHALKIIDPDTKTLLINAFHYTNPILEKVINKTYMGVIRTKPEVWDYLYDNPKVLKNVQKLRDFIHKFNSKRLMELLDDFKPNAIVCTQAFPCGMIADLKRTHREETLLFGVLTDYSPHSYWVYDSVDGYIVPCKDTGKRLIENGILKDRVNAFGIPVNPRFNTTLDREKIAKRLDLDLNIPTILIMGGSQGLGPIKQIVQGLEALRNLPFQIIVVAGINKSVYRYLNRTHRNRKKKVVFFSYTENINELMEVSSLVITKPGGLTTAEALIKGLAILIVNPLPGQEAMNTKHLLKIDVALKARDYREAVVLVEALLSHPTKLLQMRRTSKKYGRPDSAMNTAKLILDKIENV